MCTKQRPMSVFTLLDKVNGSDEQLEGNLSTVLQSVRGSKQYWFFRQGEVRCMIREFGSPTLFLTLSCGEYDSPEIIIYLRKVNTVPSSYDMGKLCTEDPIPVSRKFLIKFQAFFSEIVRNGEVLGIVDHFYWKEYQTRGAPHFHILLWIRDATVIIRDNPENVLSWIQERISCRIPDEKSDPELHRLVTRYQMHKCSAYCKRRRKLGSTFVTRCRFQFPRQRCDGASLNSVEDSLKPRKKVYNLPRTEKEERINDYSPLLLLLWKPTWTSSSPQRRR